MRYTNRHFTVTTFWRPGMKRPHFCQILSFSLMSTASLACFISRTPSIVSKTPASLIMWNNAALTEQLHPRQLFKHMKMLRSGNFKKFYEGSTAARCVINPALSAICLMNGKACVSCNLNCLFQNEGILKVTCSHVCCKCGNISETVKDEVVNTDH